MRMSLEQLEWYVLFLNEYIKDLEEQHVWDVFNKKVEELKKTDKPVDWIIPWKKESAYSNCPTCGLKLDQVMGYVCPHPRCPTGLGGAWSSVNG